MDEDDPHVSSGDPRVAAELFFLVAKFLSGGPLKETTEVLRRELEKCKILPRRLDWQGNEHDQTFEDLERQFPSVADNHLLSVCAALLKTNADKPRRSLLCNSLYAAPSPRRLHNVLDRIVRRQSGLAVTRLLPSAIYGSLQLQRRTLGHLSAVYCVLFDRTGRYIITGADDLLVKVWSAVDSRLLGTLRGASAEITDMAVDMDNRLLAAGSLDRLVRVWDIQTAAPVAVLQGHSGMITSVHFCPGRSGDLSCLVSTSTDGSVAFWTYSQSALGKPCFISKPVQYVERMRPGASQMICGSWSPGGAFLAAGSADHHVRVYMMADNGPRRILETAAHCEAVDSLQWAHSGLRFVSGSKDGTAILWQLHATQWRHTKLNMADTVTGEKIHSEDMKKLKVTMVAWDCTDSHVITAVNDYTLKVWCVQSGKLVRILEGHHDEIYVLEAHPVHPAVLLSAGHDGQIFIWDILKGKRLGYYLNNIEGQGHSAVYDAKWSPDGSRVAATDSHGHLLILGLGKGHPLMQSLPEELFFHTDYRPLVRDALGGVCDEQTGAPPHLMPPPFLVDVEGAPHPPPLQRLVPGRELAALDQLVPDTTAVGLLGVLQQDDMPRSHINYMISALVLRQLNHMPEDFQDYENEIPGRMLYRSEGVRHSAGEWQRGDPLTPSWRHLISPLARARCITQRLRIEEMTQHEMTWYRREMRRRPVMISTSNDSRPIRPRGPRRPPKPRPTQEYDEPPEVVSPQHSDSDSSVRLSITEYSGSNSSSTDHSDNYGSESSSSDYSDWVARPGVPLQPPKRSKRKPMVRQRYSPHLTGRANSAGEGTAAEAGRSTTPPLTEIPEHYRPSDWLCAVQPRKAPYHPQMGDQCMYFKQGHGRYLDAVTEKNVYKVGPKDKPWERIPLKDCESVTVVGIKYMIQPPRLVCLKLLLDNDKHFTVRYHDMPDVLDFLVLRQTYETAAERNWAPGDRFRCMIDDGWWMGAVVEGGSSGGDQFLSLRVRWDNGEMESMSPWDLEPIDDTRLPHEVGGWVSVLQWELEAVLYRPQAEDWPGGDRHNACRHIVRGIDEVMLLSIAEAFIAPVDLSVYPTYAYIVEYPIDLSTIKARFENHFYRRVTSAQFDVRYLATNAEKFNNKHSYIIKRARIITDLCLRIISDPADIDVGAVYHSIMNAYESSDSDEPLSKQRSSRNRNKNIWKKQCSSLLDRLFRDPDSAPFREPVCINTHPEYTQIIKRPMDLGKVRERLKDKMYHHPKQLAHDIRQIFINSKLYNTNRRSQIYSMTQRLESFFESSFSAILYDDHSTQATNRSDSSSSEDMSADTKKSTRLPNGHNHNGSNFSDDSSDSDAPLRGTTYKGKGKGKRSKVLTTAPTRSSTRRTVSTPQKHNGDYDDDTSMCEMGPSDGKPEDSGDSYKPSRRLPSSKRKKSKRKKEPKRRSNGKRKHRSRPKAKRRKRGSGGPASLAGSSSETGVSVASATSGRRYESDHSFQLRAPSSSDDDDDDDTPLQNIRRVAGSFANHNGVHPSTSRLRRTYQPSHSEESRAGPSGSSGRARRPARDSKRPRYNEDSEEDSIAAISKRLRAHQRPRTLSMRVVESGMAVMRPQSARLAPAPLPDTPSPPPPASPDDEPLSVSSRGRVRKLTAKARGLLRD